MGLINQLFKGRERDAVQKTDYTKVEPPPLETPVVADGDGGSCSYTYRPNDGEGVKPTAKTTEHVGRK